jgi:hypothetical protein
MACMFDGVGYPTLTKIFLLGKYPAMSEMCMVDGASNFNQNLSISRLT